MVRTAFLHISYQPLNYIGGGGVVLDLNNTTLSSNLINALRLLSVSISYGLETFQNLDDCLW